MRRAALAVVVLAATALAGCAAPRACPAIGFISVLTVEAAPGVTSIECLTGCESTDPVPRDSDRWVVALADVSDGVELLGRDRSGTEIVRERFDIEIEPRTRYGCPAQPRVVPSSVDLDGS